MSIGNSSDESKHEWSVEQYSPETDAPPEDHHKQEEDPPPLPPLEED